MKFHGCWIGIFSFRSRRRSQRSYEIKLFSLQFALSKLQSFVHPVLIYLPIALNQYRPASIGKPCFPVLQFISCLVYFLLDVFLTLCPRVLKSSRLRVWEIRYAYLIVLPWKNPSVSSFYTQCSGRRRHCSQEMIFGKFPPTSKSKPL